MEFITVIAVIPIACIVIYIDTFAVVAVAFGKTYRETSNISHILVGNKLDEHSDVVGASPVGAAPTTSSFST